MVANGQAPGPREATKPGEKFVQGHGNILDAGIPDTKTAMTNPTGQPLASLSDGTFLGKGTAPSLFDDPATKQADKTVNGFNRDSLMSALTKDGGGAPAAQQPSTTEKPTVASKEDPFAKKKLSLNS
jgi:hypothetical protein